jgi:hypothetical protein
MKKFVDVIIRSRLEAPNSAREEEVVEPYGEQRLGEISSPLFPCS